MIRKQCEFCGWCKRDYPDEIGLTIYPVELLSCPRCGDTEARQIETDAAPQYKGAPVIAKPKPQKTMF